jgi:hypothetical protein
MYTCCRPDPYCSSETGGWGALGHNVVDELDGLRRAVCVGGTDDSRDRHTARIAENLPLRADFPRSVGFAPVPASPSGDLTMSHPLLKAPIQ